MALHIKTAMKKNLCCLLIFFSHFIFLNANASESILLQSTTSTQNSGLYDYLLPIFKMETDIDVYVVAVGTGQAIKNAKNCDGDALIVHSKKDELKFVSEGYGLERYDLMYNDFVFIGPSQDPAKISETESLENILKNIVDSNSRFVSRGDESGTHKAEMKLWREYLANDKKFKPGLYIETGQGMGASLNIAVQMNAYIFADRATWISFKNKGNHEILYSGDERLFNQYGVVIVNPQKCPNVKLELAEKFSEWIRSIDGQKAINNYKIDGVQLFFGNAEQANQ